MMLRPASNMPVYHSGAEHESGEREDEDGEAGVPVHVSPSASLLITSHSTPPSSSRDSEKTRAQGRIGNVR